jgi:futalosine hydrolase
MVSTAIAATRALQAFPMQAALQVGIAGSLDPNLPVGTLVQVRQETLGELGATSPEGFLTLEKLQLPSMILDEKVYYQQFDNPHAPLPELTSASGLTVNTVSGTADQIARRTALWQPQVETMEGAAFFQACLLAGVPFHQVRAVSNPVNPRNKSEWDIPAALGALHRWLGNYLQNPVY